MNVLHKLAVVAGIALLSGAAAAQGAYGTGYGYADNDGYNGNNGYYQDGKHGHYYNGGRVIRCESHDGRTRYCNVDPRYGVRLINQISHSYCVRGQTWGVSQRGLWVTGGCRADFAIDAANFDDRHGGGRLVRCESHDSRTVYCGVDTRYGVRLVNQYSRAACIEGRSWGVGRNGIWVSRGCRAQFQIGSDSYGYGDRIRY